MNNKRKDPTPVVAFLATTGGANIRETAAHMGLSVHRAGELMCRWKKEGVVSCVGGGSGLRLWVIPEQLISSQVELAQISKAKAKAWQKRARDKAAVDADRKVTEWVPKQLLCKAKDRPSLPKLGPSSVWDLAR